MSFEGKKWHKEKNSQKKDLDVFKRIKIR